jgi:hypothetical protein
MIKNTKVRRPARPPSKPGWTASREGMAEQWHRYPGN